MFTTMRGSTLTIAVVAGLLSGGRQWTCGAGDWRNWASFEPYDLVGDRDCAELAGNGGWKADVCGYSRRFVCKVDVR